MSETWLGLKLVTDIEDCSKKTIRRRIRSGYYTNVQYVSLPNGGGKNGTQPEIALSCLSEAAQAAYYKRIQAQSARPGADDTKNQSSVAGAPTILGAGIVCPGLADWQNEIAAARYDLVSDYIKVKEQAKKLKKSRARTKRGPKVSLCRAAKDFVAAYNTGVTHPDLYAILDKVSKKTIENWALKLKRSKFDLAALAPKYGQHVKGRRKVTDAEMEHLLKFALSPNHLRIAQVVRFAKRVMDKEGVPSPSSEATLRRALLDWKEQNLDRWVFCRRGEKALDDHVLPYIERDASQLEVGDVLVADGHTLNFQVINPFTGRPGRATWLVFYDWSSRYPAGWYIMFAENIQCIHAALRRAVLNLGKTPKAVLLDNGKAFKARVFTQSPPDLEQAGVRGLYARLGIKTFFAWPYNAKAKPVERFFGTANELERLLPSYIGNSIPDKPAYLRRNEKLHKKLHNPYVPTIQQADTIIRAWVDEEYSSRPHRGLNGACPADIWQAGKGPGVDAAGLQYLMMTMTEPKPVRRNGVNILGINYYDEALYGYRKAVRVRYDMLDMESVLIYTEDGTEFICEARPMQKVHPLARLTGNPLDLEAVKQHIQTKRRLKRSTEAEARQSATEIGPWNFPEASAPAQELTRGEIEHIEQQAARTKVVSLEERRGEPDMPLWEGDAYERLIQRRAGGEELSRDEQIMMDAFEQTSQYAMLQEYYVELEMSLAEQAQAEN